MTHPRDTPALEEKEEAPEGSQRDQRWRWVGADPDDTSPDADFRRQIAAVSRQVMLARGADLSDVPPLERTVPRAGTPEALDRRPAPGPGVPGNTGAATQPPDYFDIRSTASFAVVTAFHAVRSEVEAADPVTGSLAAGLTLLAVARASRGVTLDRLVAAGDLAQSTVSTIVARLVERGLVARRRHPADRRRWVFRATADGLQEAERLAVIWRHLDDRLVGAMSVTEHEELGRLLRIAAAALTR